MAKTKKKLTALLPEYPEKSATLTGRPGMAWRREVYTSIKKAAAVAEVEYGERELLECEVVLYLKPNRLVINDVDNLLKHILDAMQGRLGEPKSGTRGWQLVPNDYQIRRVTIEKRPSSKGRRSRLTVRDFLRSARRRRAKA